MRDWLKKEMVMSKVSDQIQIKTCIHNNKRITYAFIGGLPIQYCYFVAIMLSTYTNHIITHDDYCRIVDILHEDWKDVVDVAYFRKKYKQQMGELLSEDELYTVGSRPWQKTISKKGVLPIFILKQELKILQQREKKKSPKLKNLDIIRIVVQDMEDVYESSNNDPVIL